MKHFDHRPYIFFVALMLITASCVDSPEETVLHVFASTDVHGAIFNKDFKSGEENYSSMAKLAAYLDDFDPQEYILLDNGDNLQGDPSVYYYNFEDISSKHLWARVLNYLGYDAVTVGNHDIEAGHSVYDRIRTQYNFPMLAANAVSVKNGEPYFEPFTIIERNGIRVAVMGLVTPGIPGWLPEILYEGIEFTDMVEAASKWMPVIKQENPDLIIGLFHAGWDETYEGEVGSYMNNNASLAVAGKVVGFDIIMIGHDHDIVNRFIENEAGDSVLILDGGSRARYIETARIVFEGKRKKNIISVSGNIVNLTDLEASEQFEKQFENDFLAISDYVGKEIGAIDRTISTREAYFGDSGFMDLIHKVQLENSDADLSFAAPLSFDVRLAAGNLTVADMFDLYRYENMLYTVEMSGEEIDRYLEYSYSKWLNTMTGPDDTMLKIEDSGNGYSFINRSYNFDSAAGIEYTVDLRKPDGDKIEIHSFSDGRVFDLDNQYMVAINSYRGNGGGGHLAYACSLDESELNKRLIASTEKDLRYYMIKWIEESEEIKIETDNNWRIIPETWVSSAGKRDYERLFDNKE